MFVELIALDRCNLNAGTFVEHHGHELAVFRLTGPDGVFVIDNACPHASGNLSGGDVDGQTVTCRWHQWRFDLATGVCTNSELARVRRYAAELRDGVVWIDLTT